MAVPVLHRDTHHARQATDGEPMRELDQIQQQTFQLLQSMLGASPFGEGDVTGSIFGMYTELTRSGVL